MSLIRSIPSDDPNIPRDQDFVESDHFLARNIWVTLFLVIILFITSQFWNSAAEELLAVIVGHKPRWYNNVVAALIFTGLLFVLTKYVFRVTFKSFV